MADVPFQGAMHVCTWLIHDTHTITPIKQSAQHAAAPRVPLTNIDSFLSALRTIPAHNTRLNERRSGDIVRMFAGALAAMNNVPAFARINLAGHRYPQSFVRASATPSDMEIQEQP